MLAVVHAASPVWLAAAFRHLDAIQPGVGGALIPADAAARRALARLLPMPASDPVGPDNRVNLALVAAAVEVGALAAPDVGGECAALAQIAVPCDQRVALTPLLVSTAAVPANRARVAAALGVAE